MMSTCEKETFLVAGGAGFIGVNFVKYLLAHRSARVLVLDALTYAGNASSLASEMENGSIEFFKADIADYDAVESILRNERPQYIVNFAAETHVDRSVDDPRPFIDTNVVGAYTILECARRMRDEEVRQGVVPSLKKFVQISTDEVYGDLEVAWDEPRVAPPVAGLGREALLYGPDAFSEMSPLRPSSPYSASKASADLMAVAYQRSFGLPVVVTRCSNNYGPRQFPEKLIPLMINNMLGHRTLPVYGNGTNVRDWIHVDDHCRGVLAAAVDGLPGEVYNFGGYCEMRNIDLVRRLIAAVRDLTGDPGVSEDLIRFVGDRPGHDRRYAIDATKSIARLGWLPQTGFDEGLEATVKWYLDNREWTENIVNGSYRDYYKKMYANR